MHQKSLKLRLFGFLASLILTLLAYFIILSPAYFHLDVTLAILVISILAIFQFVLQFMCFLNLWREKGPMWNLGVFVSTLSIILVIILGSIWIMYHLDSNMMPKEMMHGS